MLKLSKYNHSTLLLLASLSAAFYLIMWLAYIFKWINMPGYFILPSIDYILAGRLWHAHELIFGFFVLAFIALPVSLIKNKKLSLVNILTILTLWLSARILFILLPQAHLFLAIIDITLLIAALILLFRWPLDNKWAYVTGFILLLISNIAIHASVLEIATFHLFNSVNLAIYASVLLCLSLIDLAYKRLYRGRIIHKLAYLFFIFYMLFDLYTSQHIAIITFALLSLISLLPSFYQLMKRSTRSSYFMLTGLSWIIVALFLKIAGYFVSIPFSIGLHMFSIAAVSVSLYALIAITIKQTQLLGFILLNTACVIRLLLPLLSNDYYGYFVRSSVILWIIAFLLLTFYCVKSRA